VDEELPPLRDVVSRFGLSAKKSLGQNFLFDANLLNKIVRVAGDLTDKNVYEVGPGPGGLTRAILAANPARLVAVEKDPRCIDGLKELERYFSTPLELIAQDALEIDESQYFLSTTEIIANLPYNVGTALLIKWLSLPNWPGWWSGMTLMFQKEVAQRIVALPDTPAYGRLSVLAQWRCEARLMFDVPRQAFTPPPKITSSIIRLVPKAQVANISVTDLAMVTQAAFGQRRKMLRSTLKSISSEPEALCALADISPTARAETLSVADFCRLTQEWRRSGTPLVISATN
jgi:16S rRNA (adenine1518-N6/adenine1519-N6)-dimethyltransferase